VKPWRIEVASSAERVLGRLPETVAAAVVEFLLGPLVENPHRVGKPLARELSGLWSARRGAYRIVYRVDDDTRTVQVLRIGHRADVYRNR
jgi:mRNA-degrading endonuclease RelE of RelBE toxin-antitoxin system